MKKAGTHIPAGRSACIVFGAVTGQKSPKAGLFSPQVGAQAGQLAARAGLMTLKMSGAALSRLGRRFAAGEIGPKGQLRLQPIHPEMLVELRARYVSQMQKPIKATSGGPAGTALKPGNGASLTSATPKPPSGSPEFGQLVAAYRLVDAAGIWLEKLKAELDETLGQIGKSSAFSFLSEAETTDWDHYSGGDGWIYDGWRWTYPARYRRQKIGELLVIADIGRPGRCAAASGVPCLLVMWSGAAHSWAGSVDAAKGFWPPNDATTALVGDRCLRWIGGTPGNGSAATTALKDGAWFYVVQLDALTNFAQLRKLVVQPALAILNGTPVEEALVSADGVMRFRQHGKEFVLEK
jgi:hypothetical protein